MPLVLRVLVACLIAVAGCTGDDDAPAPKTSQYGTADASLLVLGELGAPDGLDLVDEVSGPQSVYQFAKDGDRIERLLELDALGGFTQYFSAAGDGFGDPEPAEPLQATKLYSRSLVFTDVASATSALAFFSANPHPGLTNVEVDDEWSLGRGAFLQRSRSASARYAAYYWRAGNAVIILTAEGLTGKPNERELRKLVRSVEEAIEIADPTGRSLDVPPALQPGSSIFEQTFDRAALRQQTFAVEPAGLSSYVDGGFQIGTDSSGGRYRDTGEFGEDTLADIGDGVVEADAELVQGSAVRWGLQCRIDDDGGFYLFVVGSDGYAAIFRAVSFSEPFQVLAEEHGSDAVRQAVASGRHHLQADCAGEPIARLGLHLNGELILEAYDDDPMMPGAAGMWIESKSGPAATLFDNFRVSRPAPE